MKSELRAGVTIDFLSPKEYEDGVRRLEEALRKQYPPTLIIAQASGTVTAGGVLGGGADGVGELVYRCPEGRSAHVTRGIVTDGIVTPAAPLAAGWIGFYRGQPSPSGLVQFLPESAGDNTLPAQWEDGTAQAIILRNGERLLMAGAALTANSVINVQLQVCLFDLPKNGDGEDNGG